MPHTIIPVDFIAEETTTILKRIDEIAPSWLNANEEARLGNLIALHLTHAYVHGVNDGLAKEEKSNGNKH